MDEEKLKKVLSGWVKQEYWHSGHPTDMKRFHSAVQKAFETFGSSLDVEHFESAIRSLAKKHHKDLNEEYLEKIIDSYSERATAIVCYLSDVE